MEPLSLFSDCSQAGTSKRDDSPRISVELHTQLHPHNTKTTAQQRNCVEGYNMLHNGNPTKPQFDGFHVLFHISVCFVFTHPIHIGEERYSSPHATPLKNPIIIVNRLTTSIPSCLNYMSSCDSAGRQRKNAGWRTVPFAFLFHHVNSQTSSRTAMGVSP